MKPNTSKQKSRQRDLFRPELTKMIDPGHGLVKLAGAVNWDRMEEVFGETFCPDQGRPGISSKGKAHKRYAFGCKVGVAATSRGGWFVGAKALHGNPCDGHTLKDAIKQVERIARRPKHVFVDMGYRGHGYTGKVEVHVDKRLRGRMAKSLWRWMKRRAAVESGIGHLKREHRMDLNRLRGSLGDRINAILSAAGVNFHKLVRLAADLLRQIFFGFQFCQRTWAGNAAVNM